MSEENNISIQEGMKARLLEGQVGGTLFKLTLPVLLASFMMVGFNLTDTFFVGKLGAKELAAMSFTFPVVFFFASISMGLSMGASSVVSRSIGEGNHDMARRLSTDALLLSVFIAIVFSLIGLLTVSPVFRLLGVKEEILPLIRQYMYIWYSGLLFVFTPMVANSILRATGDTKTPSLILVFAFVINIIFDPLLIFGFGLFPRLEIAGAAIATVLAHFTTMIIVLLIICFRDKLVDLSCPKIKEVLESWKKILYVGVPSAATNVMVPLSLGVITGLVAGHGTEAVAALGVGSRIESLVMLVLGALSITLIPFVGQNWGAGRRERINLAIKYSNCFSILWGTVMFFIFALTSRSIALIFNKDPKVVSALITYLWLCPVGNGFQGIFLLANASLNAVNKPIPSAMLTVIRILIFYIPLAYLGSRLFGLKGIFAGIGMANIIIGLVALFWIKRYIHATSGA